MKQTTCKLIENNKKIQQQQQQLNINQSRLTLLTTYNDDDE